MSNTRIVPTATCSISLASKSPTHFLSLRRTRTGREHAVSTPTTARARSLGWSARALGRGGAPRYGVDVCFAIEPTKNSPDCSSGAVVCTSLRGARAISTYRVFRAAQKAKTRGRRTGLWPREYHDVSALLAEARWCKSPVEKVLLTAAAEATRKGFERVLQTKRPGRTEGHLEAVLEQAFPLAGSARPAYPPIVAGGSRACTLHYTLNNQVLRDGDLLLVDAGAEYCGYASDVTRTFPVGKRFTSPQREVYSAVLRAQQAALAQVRPGATLEQVHKAAVEVILDALCAWAILSEESHAPGKDDRYKPYFMHGTSHWLGLDVHDVGHYYAEDQARLLQPGCVLTVEPGLYFAVDDETVPPAFRGLGVRIEDDVFCTEDGCDVLTKGIPKKLSELEGFKRQRGCVRRKALRKRGVDASEIGSGVQSDDCKSLEESFAWAHSGEHGRRCSCAGTGNGRVRA